MDAAMKENQLTKEQRQKYAIFEEVINSLPVKERRLWHLNIGQELINLKAMPSDRVKNLSQQENEKYLAHWNTLVGNENTNRAAEPTENIQSIQTILQKLPNVSFFPHWVMDRFKEALNQFVRGEWVSSIILSGAIVEFIVTQFMDAYKSVLPARDSSAHQVKMCLLVLKGYGILADDDYQRLDDIRRIRNDYAHNSKREKGKLLHARRQKQDDLLVLAKLSEFFGLENMQSKSERYFDYMSYAAQLVRSRMSKEK
jgi:hypothetical protein